MVARIEPLVTIDDLHAMPEDGQQYEVIEGELFVSRAPGLSHQRISRNLMTVLDTYLIQNPIGEVIATPGVIFSKYSAVIPDILFMTHQRRNEIVSGEQVAGAPELMIEILSFSAVENVRRDRIVKRQLYAKYGVAEYWIVDSENRTLEIYRLQATVLELMATLTDQNVLTSPLFPGFECQVTSLFRT